MKSILTKQKNVFFAATLIVLGKVVGAIYKISASGLLGAEGSGLYQAVFPLFALFVTVSSGGLCSCVSAEVSRADAENKSISKKTILFIAASSAVFGAALALILTFFSSALATLNKNPASAAFYISIAPAIIASDLSAVFCGYFNGKMKFTISATGSFIEQLFKLVPGLPLVALFSHGDAFAAVSGALQFVTISEILSAAFLFILFLKSKNSDKSLRSEKTDFRMAKEIFLHSAPVMLGCLVAPAVGFIESFLIINILANNYGGALPAALYGLKEGAVNSVVALPSTIFAAAAAYLLPSFAAKAAKRRQNGDFSFILSIFVCTGFFLSASLALFSKEIMLVLYSDYPPDFIESGSTLLALGSASVLASSVSYASATFLHAEKRTAFPTLALSIGAAVRLLLCLFLTPKLGIAGAQAALVAGSATTAAADAAYVGLKLKPDVDLSGFVRFLPSVTVYVVTCILVKNYFSSFTPFLSAALTAVISCFAAVSFYFAGKLLAFTLGKKT